MTYELVRGGVYLIDAEYHGRHGVLGTYLVKGEVSMVIDTGPTASIPGVLQDLQRIGVGRDELILVGATHIHLDHSGGSWRVLKLYPNSQLHVHPRGAPHMVDPSKLEAAARRFFGDGVDEYGEIRGVDEERISPSSDGEELDLDGTTVKVVWTPGHASHHQCYYVPEDRVLILGDAGGLYSARSGTILPTTPPPFNPDKAVESLDKLIALEPEIVCYGHFGYADRGVERLRSYRGQILLWSRIAERSVDEGLSIGEARELLIMEDPMLRRFGGITRRREASIMTSLLGFIEYFKWLKGEDKRRADHKD